jgi:hypothetical protein
MINNTAMSQVLFIFIKETPGPNYCAKKKKKKLQEPNLFEKCYKLIVIAFPKVIHF